MLINKERLKRMKKHLILVLVSIMTLFCFMGAAHAMTVSLSASDVAEDGTFSVDVKVKDNPGFASFMCIINYDADLIYPVAGSTKCDLYQGMIVVNADAPGANVEKLSYYKISGANAGDMKSDGVLFSCDFKVKEDATGTVQLSLYEEEGCGFFNQDYNQVEATYKGTSLTVGEKENKMKAIEIRLSKTKVTEGKSIDVTTVAIYEDGTEEEVEAEISVKPSSIATVKTGSLVTKKDGEGEVTAIYGDFSDTVGFTVTKKQMAIGGGSSGTIVKPDDSEEEKPEEKPEEPASPVFTDLSTHAYAIESIEALSAKGIVKGITQTEYAPGNTLTRAQLAALLVRMFGFTETADITHFTDVSESDWFYADVRAAYAAGVIKGVSDTSFNPNGVVTREQTAVMIMRALSASNTPMKEITDTAYPFTEDEAEASDYAKESICKMYNLGLIQGVAEGRFAPQASLIRADIACILFRISKMN